MYQFEQTGENLAFSLGVWSLRNQDGVLQVVYTYVTDTQ